MGRRILTLCFFKDGSNGINFLIGNQKIPNLAANRFFGWSTTGGDLRVPHFFATHAMQALPLAGWLADRVWPARARALVWLAAPAYSAVVIATFVQARAGIPFLG